MNYESFVLVLGVAASWNTKRHGIFPLRFIDLRCQICGLFVCCQLEGLNCGSVGCIKTRWRWLVGLMCLWHSATAVLFGVWRARFVNFFISCLGGLGNVAGFFRSFCQLLSILFDTFQDIFVLHTHINTLYI